MYVSFNTVPGIYRRYVENSGGSRARSKSRIEVPGLLFAEDFVRMSDISEGPQKQIDAVIEFSRKRRLSANVKK